MSQFIKEIRSRFDQRFIQITPMGWVESNGHILGRLLIDLHTKKLYFRSNIHASPYNKLKEYRMDFLSKFSYTQQLSCLNVGFNTVHYVVELHGFIKDM